MATAASSRRGRPRAGEEAARREAVLEAAVAELAEHGYEATTMQAVARRAGASKETLYAWFGNKPGLFAALIRHNAEQTNQRVAAALDHDADPRAALTAVASGLLGVLTSPRAVAINRAAMSSPELAQVLLTHGRHTTGPLVERYLAHLSGQGHLAITDPAEAFRLLYGLTIQDTQIRTLLGEPPPDPQQLADQAHHAVDRFLTLTTPTTRQQPGGP